VRNNVWGTQFHPEKSGETGLKLIRAFVQTVDAAARAKESIGASA
jgi:imidazoleglycerol phosphate synthase glutamine amidotransferase subunit HisH